MWTRQRKEDGAWKVDTMATGLSALEGMRKELGEALGKAMEELAKGMAEGMQKAVEGMSQPAKP